MTNTSNLDTAYNIHRLQKDNSGEDYVYIRFPRTAGRDDGHLVELLSIVSQPRKLLNRLDDLGANLPKSDREDFIAQLVGRLPDQAGILTSSTGWKGTHPQRVFVLPSEVIGTATVPVVLTDAAKEKCVAVGRSGTTERWMASVAYPAMNSTIAAAAILAAMSAPLFAFSGLTEGFILNFAGRSSSGKTTANRCGASVWGNPSGVLGWNATSRGLAELAAAHNDIALVLDDAEQADENPKKRLQKLNEVTHTLTSGKGKVYSRVVSGEDRLPKLTFTCTVLSSSPRTIEADAQRQRKDRTDGDRVRLLEVQVNDGSLGGIWDRCDNDEHGSARRSESISAATSSNFGEIGHAWVRYLVEHQDTLEARVKGYIEEFRSVAAPSSNDIKHRISGKIGLLYSAGVLAAGAGLLPWSREQVYEVSRTIYRSVLTSAFGEQFDPMPYVAKLLKEIRGPGALNLPRVKNLRDVSVKADDAGYVDRRNRRIYLRLNEFEEWFYASRGKQVAQERDQLLQALINVRALKAAAANGSITHDVRIGTAKQKMLVFRTVELIKVAKAVRS